MFNLCSVTPQSLHRRGCCRSSHKVTSWAASRTGTHTGCDGILHCWCNTHSLQYINHRYISLFMWLWVWLTASLCLMIVYRTKVKLRRVLWSQETVECVFFRSHSLTALQTSVFTNHVQYFGAWKGVRRMDILLKPGVIVSIIPSTTPHPPPTQARYYE